MKKISKILVIGLIFIIFTMCGMHSVYAIDPDIVTGEDETDYKGPSAPDVKGDTKTGLPSLNNNFKPTASITGTAKSTVELILGVLQVVGIVAVVVGIGLIGFNTILGSAGEKAIAQEQYVGIVIAAVVITAGSTIAKFLINAAEKM